MEWVMGVMIVIMVVGFLGFGHRGMMGGHGMEERKSEAVIQDKDKAAPCKDSLKEPEKKEAVVANKEEPKTEAVVRDKVQDVPCNDPQKEPEKKDKDVTPDKSPQKSIDGVN